jgi:hypothetical protein
MRRNEFVAVAAQSAMIEKLAPQEHSFYLPTIHGNSLMSAYAVLKGIIIMMAIQRA